MNIEDVTRKRTILVSARLRFSPTTQPVKDAAIDRIVEQTLLLADDKGLNIQQIQEQAAISLATRTPLVNWNDLDRSLDKLLEQGRVTSYGEPARRKFRLSNEAAQDLWKIQNDTEQRINRVLNELFRDAPGGPSKYSAPFFEFLSLVFSRLGEVYVRYIQDEFKADELLRLPNVDRTLASIKSKYRALDESVFRTAVFAFFRDRNPDYDMIKWNMAQNYYVAKALGLDNSGRLLSDEVFGNAVVYLDTNVLIHALEPTARYHASYKALSSTCERLNIELRVCRITLVELRGTAERHRELILEVADLIPDETSPKVAGDFYQLYREKMDSDGSVDLDKLFAIFMQPYGDLAESLDLELVDDTWFDDAVQQRETTTLVQQMTTTMPKSERTALHDALLLRWIQRERERDAENVWLVTRDSALPHVVLGADSSPGKPLAITLPALLQWMSPLAVSSDTEDQFAAVFAEAIEYQLLPQESFFSLNDFRVFAEMEIQSKELPAEDVEQFILFLRANAANLDPNDPVDQEKLAYEMNKFFADTGTKYQQNLRRMETELTSAQAETQRTAEQLAQFKQEVENRYEQQERKLQEYEAKLTERDERISERDERIGRLEEDRGELRAQVAQGNLRASALARLPVAVILFAVLEAVLVAVYWWLAESTKVLQKLPAPELFVAISVVLLILTFWVVLGKERIRVLGWPFTRFLGG